MGDAGLEDDSYETVYSPPLDGKLSTEEVTGLSENAGVQLNPKKWQQLPRDFRVVEYAFAIVLYIIARRLGKWMSIHTRKFPRVEMRVTSADSIWGRDPAMDEEELSEQVPMHMLIIVSLAIAIGINLFMNYVCPMIFKVRVIAHDFRDFLLSLGQAVTLSTFLVNFMKNMTGRFRPCFFAMCGWNYDVVWDGVTDLCSDSAGDDEGRRSFPSGHSSFAWSVLGVLTLYLLGRARLTSATHSRSIVQESIRTFKLFFCFLPCLAAAWVAITRSTDNRHHYSDIVAGSAIGAAAASLAYNHNYGSMYAWEWAGLPWEAIHERRKTKVEDREERNGVSNLTEHVIRVSTRGSSSPKAG